MYDLLMYIVAYATQSTTSSLPVNWQQQSKKPVDYDRSLQVPSTAIPVITKTVSSLASELACSKPSLKQMQTLEMAAAKWSGDSQASRRCSSEEIEQKKQEAVRKRRALRLNM